MAPGAVTCLNQAPAGVTSGAILKRLTIEKFGDLVIKTTSAYVLMGRAIDRIKADLKVIAETIPTMAWAIKGI